MKKRRDGEKMNSRLEIIKSTSIVFMRHIGPYGSAENFLLMQKMKEWIIKHNLWSDSGVLYAIAWDNESIPAEKCRYDVCFVTCKSFAEEEIYLGNLPKGTYLVYQISHTTEAVKYFWESLIEHLKQNNQCLDSSRPILERYKIDLVELGYCEFCIPIVD